MHPMLERKLKDLLDSALSGDPVTWSEFKPLPPHLVPVYRRYLRAANWMRVALWLAKAGEFCAKRAERKKREFFNRLRAELPDVRAACRSELDDKTNTYRTALTPGCGRHAEHGHGLGVEVNSDDDLAGLLWTKTTNAERMTH